MIISDPVILETVNYVTAFGVGLWDTISGRIVSDDIEVRVFALAGGRPRQPVNAAANRSGIFIARGLPGLSEFEKGAGDDAFWNSVPSPLHAPLPFLVAVRDARERFTAFVMHIDLPAKRGFAVPACSGQLLPIDPKLASPASPPGAPAYVPLFSTPARPVPAGMTVVRATLCDAGTHQPAECAVLEVSYAGRLLARGVADHRGEVAAILPYPEPEAPSASPPAASPVGSPLGAATPAHSLNDQEWQLDVAVRYQPDLPRYKTDAAARPLADLCEMIQQPYATLSTVSPAGIVSDATLHYGEPLVLADDAGGKLFISPV